MKVKTNRVLIDDVEHVVHSTRYARYGFVALTVGLPGDPPSGEHSVPGTWWDTDSTGCKVITGGHKYKRVTS